MRSRVVVGLVWTWIALVALLGVAQVAAAEPESSDEAAIRALIEEVEAANNAGDVERWLGHFADDAVYMPPGVPAVTTREGLAEIARAGFRNRAAVDIEPVAIEIAGDRAFAHNRVTGTITVHGSGDVIEIDVKQVVVYRRGDDGTWKIAWLISNSNTE